MNATRFSAGLALASLGLGAIPAQADEAHALRGQPNQFRPQPTILAQFETCRQVSSGITGLNVRRAPSLTAEVVGVVPSDRSVTLESLGTDGWAPISEPYDGYVSTNYLTTCESLIETAATPVDTPDTIEGQCRQVIVRSGLNVRAKPSRYSNRLTALAAGTNVQVSGPETEHWVQITEPVDGYVAERFLGECS